MSTVDIRILYTRSGIDRRVLLYWEAPSAGEHGPFTDKSYSDGRIRLGASEPPFGIVRYITSLRMTIGFLISRRLNGLRAGVERASSRSQFQRAPRARKYHLPSD